MKRIGLRFLALLLAAQAPPVWPQSVDLHARIVFVPAHGHKTAAHAEPPEAVLWLKPLNPQSSFAPPAPGHFRMAQKNKTFQPHLLVIPLGSTVAFPNLDPFFHNVFSQFNGKRFDLGLYEAGSTRDVRFDHEGVSYIFCNIHPEMSAVIITVSSPWYSIASGENMLLHNVSPGAYEMHVWASGADARQLDALTRRVQVDAGSTSLGTISIQSDTKPPAHKNKFGQDYRPESTPVY